MFFIILCVFLWALFALSVPFDQFGWLFCVGFAWFCGFMDGKRSATGTEPDETMPPAEA